MGLALAVAPLRARRNASRRPPARRGGSGRQTLHEAGHRCGPHAGAHDGFAQRLQVGEEMQPGAAQRLHGQEVRQERVVERIDGHLPRPDVGHTRAMVAVEHVAGSDVRARLRGGVDDLGQGGGIAEAEVEALSPDRWHHVGRFPDEGYAAASQRLGGQAGQREHAAMAEPGDRSKKSLQLGLENVCELSIRQLGETARFFGALDPDEARAVAGERHHCQWSAPPV